MHTTKDAASGEGIKQDLIDKLSGRVDMVDMWRRVWRGLLLLTLAGLIGWSAWQRDPLLSPPAQLQTQAQTQLQAQAQTQLQTQAQTQLQTQAQTQLQTQAQTQISAEVCSSVATDIHIATDEEFLQSFASKYPDNQR
jgi:ferric-dicitrate binding protein FerR (iron transport regulator)